MHFVSSSPKWIDSLLSTNQSHKFTNSLFKAFSISMTFLCWHKMLVLSLCRYVWVFDEACGKGPNIDHWETPQFMVPTKKALFVRYEWNHFIVLSEKPTHFILPNKILRSEVSKFFRRSIKITLVCFPFSPPFKIKSVNWDKHVSVEWFALKPDW